MAIITSTSFKGTTTEALAASAAEIKTSTKVTITDNTYTAANLIAILAKTNNHPVVLEKTAAGMPLSAPYADIVTIIEGVNKYTGSLTATGDVPAEQLNIIAKGTTGKVTATLDPATTIDAATVTALKDVNSTDNITFVTAETEIVGKSNLEAFVALNKKLSDADWTTITDFKGTASELSAIKSALGIKKTADVEITSGQISAADANALSKAGGDLTATLKSATVKATLSALKDIKATDVLDFTTTETTVNASDLVALEDKLVLGTQDYTSITTITETAAAVAKDVTTVTGALGIATDADVKISGNISATNAATIATATAGTLTATIFPGTAQNLEAALNGVTGALTLTLTDETVVAGDLDALTAVTTVAINANSVKTITADAADVADVSAVYAAAALKQISGLGNEIISITGVAISAVDTNTLAGLTSGKVVATVTADSAAALLAALAKADAKDELTLTVTGASDAKDLLALDAKTALAITLPATASISGTAAEIKKVYASKGITTANDEVITVTDPASAADVNAIAKLSGAVTATIKDGSVATTLKTLKDVVGADTITFKTTDKTVNADDLVQLKTLVDNFTTTSVTTITSKAADIGAAGATVIAALVIAPNAAVTITNGAITAANAGLISNATTGKVTATVAADLAANIVTGLGAVVAADADDALNITVNGATASVADLNTIDSQTALKVKVDAATVTATNYAQFEGIYVTNKNNFSSLGDENIDVGGSVTAAQADAIAKATSKEAKATVDAAAADLLVANLKNANAKDALTLTVTGAATAKDLLTLDGKTLVALNVNGVTTITGTAADVKKVYDAVGIATQGDEAITLTGTVKASDANALALQTSGVVTATIAADTATNLNAALTDNLAHNNAYTLTVNGATASAATLELLNAKTTEDIKVDAKEVTGTFAEVETVYVTNATDYTGLGNKNVKIAGSVTTGTNDIDAILDATTGIVTATLTSDSATDLLAATTEATAKDALTLTLDVGAESAEDLLILDGRTSVTVNASAVTAVTGSAAELKQLLASKGVSLAKGVDINISDVVVKAADVNAIAKATSGLVTATVEAGTAAALNKALTDKDLNALTLTVNGATAAAADLVALDAKTSVSIQLDAASITGNIVDVTKVFVTDALHFNGEETKAVTISGEIAATEADAIADRTSGVVTATIKAADANTLNTTLVDLGSQVNAYKLTVNGTTAAATDLVALDAKTSVTVNAAAIKNISGNAADVKAAYEANALKTISGLGNETVDLTSALDANVSLVKAINDYTTGVITLDTLNTATAGGNFSLSQLGDLKGITGLAEINADNGAADNITISIKDLLAANDSTNSFAFNIVGGNGNADTVSFTDVSGWTKTIVTPDIQYTFKNDVTSQVITVNLTDATVL
ncbi:beta strand repeat-containing protein [Aliarcobacter butzleri]